MTGPDSAAVLAVNRSGVRYERWRDRAACKGADLSLFFGPDGESQPGRLAREASAAAVCVGCPVRLDCLEFAASRPEEYGTWGGQGEDERSAVLRRAPRPLRTARPAARLRKSRHAGVTWKAQKRRWVARVPRDGRRVYLGSFTREADAARAVLEAEGALPEIAASPAPQPRKAAA